jgi:hypothetical protein
MSLSSLKILKKSPITEYGELYFYFGGAMKQSKYLCDIPYILCKLLEYVSVWISNTLDFLWLYNLYFEIVDMTLSFYHILCSSGTSVGPSPTPL